MNTQTIPFIHSKHLTFWLLHLQEAKTFETGDSLQWVKVAVCFNISAWLMVKLCVTLPHAHLFNIRITYFLEWMEELFELQSPSFLSIVHTITTVSSTQGIPLWRNNKLFNTPLNVAVQKEHGQKTHLMNQVI